MNTVAKSFSSKYMQVSNGLPVASLTDQPSNKMVALLLKWKYICEKKAKISKPQS